MLPLRSRPRDFPLPIRFLSSASVLPPATQPSVSSFPHFPAPPHSGFPGAPLPLTLPRFSPFVPAWFPMPCFRFSYSACCSFPFVPPGFAPTAVPPVLPFFSAFASLPGFSACLPLPFVRFGLLLTTQPSVFLFPSSRSPLTAVLSVRSGSLRPLCFPLSIPVLSFLRFPFSARCFVSQALHSRRPPVSSSAAPLAFALGSGYLALSFWVLVPRSDLTYISTRCRKCQHLFFIFFNYYLA